jgi:hypothetical protein
MNTSVIIGLQWDDDAETKLNGKVVIIVIDTSRNNEKTGLNTFSIFSSLVLCI